MCVCVCVCLRNRAHQSLRPKGVRSQTKVSIDDELGLGFRSVRVCVIRAKLHGEIQRGPFVGCVVAERHLLLEFYFTLSGY